MKRISVEQIIHLHSLLIAQSGGMKGLRDRGLLESAVRVPFQSFGNQELYPSIQIKAAQLCYSIISNHPFNDGNKRVGILTMLIFLRINYIDIQCEDEDIIDLGLGIALGKYNTAHIVEWISLYSQ